MKTQPATESRADFDHVTPAWISSASDDALGEALRDLQRFRTTLAPLRKAAREKIGWLYAELDRRKSGAAPSPVPPVPRSAPVAGKPPQADLPPPRPKVAVAPGHVEPNPTVPSVLAEDEMAEDDPAVEIFELDEDGDGDGGQTAAPSTLFQCRACGRWTQQKGVDRLCRWCE